MSDKEERKATLKATKARLIKEGELYRYSVQHAKHQVAQNLHPDVLLHGAVDMAVGAVQTRVAGLLGSFTGGGSGGGGSAAAGAGASIGIGTLLANYKRLMPIALSIGSYISRRHLVKPAIGVGVIAAAVGAWVYKRKQSGSL
ncbi:hypothetical protein IP91_01224 [Pseudoduganella lurida]|uniref:Uncharacterized protein n=1 Tax=Pseudoduganella lurida TaxID=1036180 RepID=A0A562RNJ1_9BURK|nr:hypothetical protein [Pseudoduganella lurida]TWI70144.1 hypothetical protein IP91_01224 [Pseudoduganella lurida]